MKNHNIPDKALILAAGFGTRLRPHTNDKPKPMVEVNGRSLIWRTLDKLRAAGISYVVVNAHYNAELLAQHMADYMAQHDGITIQVSLEDEILDTGGGVVNALHYFDDAPFYVIAGDNLWTDGDVSALKKLAVAWDGDTMGILTLMQATNKMELTQGVGDYDIEDNGTVKRSHDKSGAYMWTNIRLNHPRIYDGYTNKKFSFLEIMDACEAQEQFYAIEHDGDWHHISTPDDLAAVDAHFKKSEGE